MKRKEKKPLKMKLFAPIRILVIRNFKNITNLCSLGPFGTKLIPTRMETAFSAVSIDKCVGYIKSTFVSQPITKIELFHGESPGAGRGDFAHM